MQAMVTICNPFAPNVISLPPENTGKPSGFSDVFRRYISEALLINDSRHCQLVFEN